MNMNNNQDYDTTHKYSLDQIRELLDTYKQPCLLVCNRKKFGTIIPLKKKRTIVGRESDEVLKLGDSGDGVSKIHAEFIIQEEYVEVNDLDSHNGVYVNHKKVDSAKLTGGEKIVMGRVILQFQYLSQNEIESYRAFSLDPLTGAYNKKFYLEHIDNIFWDNLSTGIDFSLIIIDLNSLKDVNDTHGHLAGDYVLATFGEIVKETISEDSLFFRFGGDEFIIIMPEVNAKGALAFSEMLKDKIAAHEFIIEKKKVPVSIEVGISETYELPKKKSYKQLLDLADKRLYQAKLKRQTIK